MDYIDASTEALELMRTPVTLANGRPSLFGLGRRVMQHNNHRVVIVAGQQDVVSSILLMVPGRNAAVILMSNLERAAEQLTSLVGKTLQLASIT